MLENDLRQLAEESGYRDGFIAHPQVKVIYFERFVVEVPHRQHRCLHVTPLANLIDAQPILPPIAPV